MTILKGYEHKQGSFLNKQTEDKVFYDNFVLHYESDERPEVKGLFCGSIKCKAGTFQILGQATLDDLIGKPVLMVMDMTANTPTVNALVPLDVAPNARGDTNKTK